jgi:hypothetical protein
MDSFGVYAHMKVQKAADILRSGIVMVPAQEGAYGINSVVQAIEVSKRQ